MAKNINGCIGRSAGDFGFDKNPRCLHVGRKVVLENISKGAERILDGGIIVPESAEINERMSKYRVVDRCDLASEEYGIEIGDVVLADRLSCYYDTYPIQVLDFENIICKIVGEEDPFPFKGMVFVEYLKPKTKKIGDIYLADISSSEIPLGYVTKSSSEFINAGDIIIMTGGADMITVDGRNFRIYKDDMPVCTVELDDDEYELYDFESVIGK